MGEGTKHKTARNMAHLTLEEAAEKLYTSVSTLKRVESGKQKCDPWLESKMADLYGYQWVADPCVPEYYKPMPMTEAMLKYINEREDVERLLPGLRRILADGVIDEDEKPEADRAAREIEEEQRANRDLRYAICG